MDRPKFELADIFRRYGEAYRQKHGASMSTAQRCVMTAVEVCRTAALGGQIEQCDQCGHRRFAYRSCRNRHCPKCQSLARAEWIQHRQAELLDCEYFHVVFTVPEEIASIAYQNKEVVYSILFRATAETLRTIAADPKHLGAEIGFFAVLHTWGSNLLHHPHLHCVVPGGGLSPDGSRWIACKPGFFLPVRVLSRLFRRLFLEHLSRTLSTWANCNSSPPWNIFGIAARLPVTWRLCERRNGSSMPNGPLPDPSRCWTTSDATLIAWRSRTIACWISKTARLRFRWKDYRNQSQQKTMTLSAEEFIRRFLLHALPDGFHRIRYYGFLGNRYRQEKLTRCRQLLGMAASEVLPEHRPRITVIGTKNSPELRCASAQCATVATW